jgi:hypothetical protein
LYKKSEQYKLQSHKNTDKDAAETRLEKLVCHHDCGFDDAKNERAMVISKTSDL